jgi:hypothetical protein
MPWRVCDDLAASTAKTDWMIIGATEKLQIATVYAAKYGSKDYVALQLFGMLLRLRFSRRSAGVIFRAPSSAKSWHDIC